MRRASWFDLNFPWIGGGGALVLLVLLFGTDLLQSDSGPSRWHDRVWLAWLAMAAYLIHNIEEYGIDMLGRRRGFVTGINDVLKLPPEPDSPIPALYFTSVNVPLFWIGAPIAALLSERHPLVGLVLYAVILINALVHILPLLAGAGYSSGTLTAIFIFLPLSIWVGYTCFGDSALSYQAMGFLIVMGVIFHIILMAPIQLFIRGKLGATAMIGIQYANAVLLFLIPWIVEKCQGRPLI